MTSTRYAIPVIILLLLALVPTTIHSYLGATTDDGKSVKKIPRQLDDFISMPSKRNKQWGRDIFESFDWFERDYRNADYKKVRLFVARSFNHKKLYHHAELALSYAINLSHHKIGKLPGQNDIPIHILTNDNHSIVVIYALEYDNHFIDNPITHQLSESMRLLINPRKPMTLFYASQTGVSSNVPTEQTAAMTLLSLAIQNFKQQSPSPTR